MQDFSLKFFSRTVQFSQGEELFFADYKNRPLKDRDYKLEALGLLTYLQMLLFSDAETGFYYDVSGNRFQLLANKLGVSPKQLNQLLNSCFKYSILDKAMYQKYQILTSYKMQDDYSRVLDKPQDRVRAQNINMDYVYQDCDFTQKYKNALQKYKNALQKRENALQKTGEETRPEQIEKDNIRENSPSPSAFSLDEFKKAFPNKKTEKAIKVPDNVDLALLTKKMKEQPWLLDKNNLDWAWCIKNYKEIVFTNRYASGCSRVNSPSKTTTNYQQRDYSGTDLNKLFDNIEDVELGPPAEMGPEEEQ